MRPHSSNCIEHATRPQYSQSSRENATPSSSTSPLASYTEVPPSPPPGTCPNLPRIRLRGTGYFAIWRIAKGRGKEKFTGMIPLTLINLRRRMLYMKHKFYRLDNVWRIIIIALLLMFLWIWGKIVGNKLIEF